MYRVSQKRDTATYGYYGDVWDMENAEEIIKKLFDLMYPPFLMTSEQELV